MRKFFRALLVLVGIVCLSMPLAAQQAGSQNLFKASLLSPLVRTGSFFYERVLGEQMSGQLGFFYTGISVGETNFNGIGITPEFRYYLSETKGSPTGVFVAPYLRYQNFKLSENTVTDAGASFTGMGGGLLIGAQRLFRNVISLEAFIGPSYTASTVKITSGQHSFSDLGYFDGFGVRFGCTIGVGF
jgi:hypothetical protein